MSLSVSFLTRSSVTPRGALGLNTSPLTIGYFLHHSFWFAMPRRTSTEMFVLFA